MSEKLEFDLSVPNNGLSKALGDAATKARILEGAISSAIGNFAARKADEAFSRLSGAIEGSIKEARSFSRSVAEINSILPKNAKLTEETTDALTALAKQYGSDSQTEAKAFYEIISSGIVGTKNQLAVLTTANEAATAGLVEINTAATVIVSSMNSYASSGLTATQASDSLFQAVKDGVTTFGELANTLGRVTPIASAAGVSFQDASGSIAFLTSVGIKTDQAVTGLRATLSSIIKPSEEAKKAAENLGLELSINGIKAAGGFAEYMDVVRQKTGGSATAIAKLFGDVNAANTVIAITGGGFDRFSEQIDNNRKSLGATADAAKEVKKSLDFQLGQLEAEAKALSLTFGNLLVPVIQDFATGLKVISSQFKTNNDQYAAQRERLAELGKKYNEVTDAINTTKKSMEFQRKGGLEDSAENIQKLVDLEKIRNQILQERQGLRTFVTTPSGDDAGTGANSKQAEIDAAQAAADRIVEITAFQNSQLLNLDEQLRVERANVSAEAANAGIQDTFAKQEAELQRMMEFDAQKTELEFQLKEQEAARLEDEVERKFQIAKVAKEKELAFAKQANAMQVKEAQLLSDKTKAIKEQENQTRKIQEAQTLAIIGLTANAASALMKEGSKELFYVQKAAALAQAVVAMNTGMANALLLPPPAQPAAIAFAKSTGAIAISGIVASAIKGYAQGGIVGDGSTGATSGKDTQLATVRDGEMFLNAQQQKNLFDMINGGGGTGDIVVQIGEEVVFRAVRNQIKKGYKLS